MSVITNKAGALEYLTAEGIAVPHCFTTRFGGVSEGHLASLNLGIHRGDKPENVRRNYEILGEALGSSSPAMLIQPFSRICASRSMMPEPQIPFGFWFSIVVKVRSEL